MVSTGCRQRFESYDVHEWSGVSDTIASEILEISPDNFRQSLSRARRDLYQFMSNQCGLINASNPCRCHKKTKGFIDAGHVDPNRMTFSSPRLTKIRSVAADTYAQIDDVVDQQYAALFRDHPFLEPKDQIFWLRKMLEERDFRDTLHLN